jgi:ATP-dependent RNA helicase DDX19/DBP5
LKDYLESKEYKVAFVYQKNGDIKTSAEFLQQQIQDFLEGKYRILLTTNLLSRGIDMRKVTLVVNYNLPLKFFEDPSIKRREVDLETYLHRVGRTGRFGDKGVAINFVEEPKDLNLIANLEEHYGMKIDRLEVS